MAQKFVGVDLGSHHVKVVVVSAGVRGVQVIDAFTEPVAQVHDQTGGDDDEADVDPLGAVLAVALGVLKQRRLLSQPMGLALPPSLCSYRVLEFPFSDDRRIAATIGFEAEGQFPVALEDLFYGHVTIPTPGTGGRALVAAARRDKVGSIFDIFKRAGADLKIVTSGAVATAQISARPAPMPISPELSERGLEPVSLLVDLGHTTTQLVALGPKGPKAIRTARRGGRHITAAIARAYQMPEAEAEVAKHRDAFLPHHGLEQMSEEQLDAGRIVARAIEPVVREIGHTRMWLRATYKLEVTKIVLAGGGASLQGLIGYLAEQTGLEVQRLRPSGTMVKNAEGRDWTSYGAALGAAYGAARRPLLQLHDASTSEGEGSWMQERMSSLIAIGIAVMAFGALDTIAQVKALEAEKAAYEDELAAVTLETFGEELGPSKIEAKLAEVEGQDLTSLVPEKGALEVLARLTEAATPSDLGTAPPPGAAVDPVTGEPLPAGATTGTDPVTGQPLPLEGDEEGADGGEEGGSEGEGAEEGGEKKEKEIIDPERGIVMSDELTFSSVEIRERKIDLKVDANSSSAQERLARKLKTIECIANIQNGKVRGGDRKNFEMSMDNNCYYASPDKEAEAEAEADGEDADAEAEGAKG